MAVKIKPPKSKLLHRINLQVRACEKKKRNVKQKDRHLPTVAAIIRYRKGKKFLLIEPKIELNIPELRAFLPNPGVAKGGVKRGEDVISALYRELEEELSIQPSQLKVVGYCGSRSVRSFKQKIGRELKRYFFFYVEYDGPRELVLNPSELSSYQWLTVKQVREEIKVLIEHRPDKHAALDAVFAVFDSATTQRKKKKKNRSNIWSKQNLRKSKAATFRRGKRKNQKKTVTALPT